MRALLAIALIFTGFVALPPSADARKGAYRAGPPVYAAPRYQQPRYYRPPAYTREQVLCEERAFAEDPTGLYAGYPCWAREAFGRGPGGRGR